MKDILDQTKQSIKASKSEHPTGTITMTFHKQAEEKNPYVLFGYVP